VNALELRCVSIVLLTATLIAPAIARQKEDFASLETEATRALDTETELFAGRAALVARLRAGSERAPDANQRARLALLWLRAMRSLLSTVPFGGSNEQPYQDWLAQYEKVVVYSEPAGQWLLFPEVVWRVHDEHKASQAAEAIAWFAVQNGYPGECEGYIPCYANIMNWKRLSTADAERYLNVVTDCGDLKAGLVPLRHAVEKSTAARRSAAIDVIDGLLARCR
jgi:hypothetical protein